MAVRSYESGGHIPPMTALDQEALALLISLRDNPDIQQDSALLKMFSDAISFMTAPPSFLPQPTESQENSLSSLIQIRANGQDGDHGLPRAAAPLGGGGMTGVDGSDGENARDIHLHLAATDEIVSAQWDQGNASIQLGDSAASISLQAIGGRGGKGGSGGNGGQGAQGAQGRDATSYASGENGKRGLPGGIGGSGGDGGNGGQGGNIRVLVSPEDTDLLMLLNLPQLEGGVGGKGGSGGKGGPGGNGGQGGSSHSWSETRMGTRTTFNGREGARTETYTYAVSRFNPGGSAGSRGPNGETGRVGSAGKSGKQGSFQIVVGSDTYHHLYDLAIKTAKIVDLEKGNPADFYEPGEVVNLMVSVTNTGGMPTPPQDIDIAPCPAQWIEYEDAPLVLRASEYLQVNASHTFSTPFSFRIKDQFAFMGDAFNQQNSLSYRAVLRRMNRPFVNACQQKVSFPVRYPVQISPLEEKAQSIFSEGATLGLSIQNITSISMGKSGPQKRRVFVSFEVALTEGLQPSDVELLKTSESDLQEANKVTIEIDALDPQSETSLTTTFRFTNSLLHIQSKVSVIASLYLDAFRSEKSPPLEPRCIQKRSIEMPFSKLHEKSTSSVLEGL